MIPGMTSNLMNNAIHGFTFLSLFGYTILACKVCGLSCIYFKIIWKGMEGVLVDEDRKNRVTVNIYGEPYTIIGNEQSGHVRMVAGMVDDIMREIKDANPNLDTKRLAVLTSVN